MWHDILLSTDYIGDTVTKGEGYFKKDYVYILIPDERYKNYTFLLSARCISDSSEKKQKLLSIEDDMNIDLFYHPECREQGKKYKRYKMKGSELVDDILLPYEHNLIKESNERQKKEKAERDSRNKKVFGRIIYGLYHGNMYNRDDRDLYPRFYFEHDGIFYCPPRLKVRNVEVEFVLYDNVTKYFFDNCSSLLEVKTRSYQNTLYAIKTTSSAMRILAEEGLLSPELTQHYTEILSELEHKSKILLQQSFLDLQKHVESIEKFG